MREFLHRDVIKNEIRRYFKNKAERDIDTVDIVDANAELQKIFDEAFGDDVAPVKHGHWKLLIFKGGRRSGQAEAKCSICGRDAVYQITEEKWEFENYCPHCGAKMDGDSNV